MHSSFATMANTPFRNLFSLIHRRFVSTSSLSLSSSSSSRSQSFTVKYLMNNCGLPLKSAISISKMIILDEKRSLNPDCVLDFLKSHGFSDTQITKSINKNPLMLLSRVEGYLKPKFEFIENGFKGALLPELIASNPLLLRRSLNSTIKPLFECLKKILVSEEKIISASRRSALLLTSAWKGKVKPNIAYLISKGVTNGNLIKLIRLQPRSVVQKLDRIVYAVDYIKKLGLEPNASMFVRALSAMSQMSKLTWGKKFEVLRCLGWSEEHIVVAFRRNPYFLVCSEEKLRRATDFYLNTMKVDLARLSSDPSLLTLDIDQRLRRYNVLKVLLSKNFLKEKTKIVWLLKMREEVFRNKYVLKHADKVPELLLIYDVTGKKKRIVTS